MWIWLLACGDKADTGVVEAVEQLDVVHAERAAHSENRGDFSRIESRRESGCEEVYGSGGADMQWLSL